MRLSKSIQFNFAAILLVICTNVTTSAETEVMFILDSSGSMAEAAGGQRKIDAAKQVMRQIVPEIAKQASVGLTVYGHRSKGDCSDIEVLVPPGSSDHLSLLQHVESLRPTGKTPISNSILTVAGLIKTRDVQSTIILISDGIETCGGDPCAIAEKLKQTGMKLVIHVVGFDVDANAAAQLSCIADKTGGKYHSANDTDSLLKALNSVKNDVALQVADATAKTTVRKSGIGTVQVTMPEGAEDSLAFIEFFRDEASVLKVERPAFEFKKPMRSGKYRVVAGFALPNYGKPTLTDLGEITVNRGETFDLRLGSISFNIPRNLVDNGDHKQRLHVEEVIIADAGSNEPVVTIHSKGNGFYNFKTKPVLAGVYNILFRYYNGVDEYTVVAENVDVQPGRDAVVTLNTGIQLKESDAGMIRWDLIPSPIATVEGDATEEDSNTTFKPFLSIRDRGNFRGGKGLLAYPYIVPAGKYDIVVFMEGMTESLPVAEGLEIKEGEVVLFDPGF